MSYQQGTSRIFFKLFFIHILKAISIDQRLYIGGMSPIKDKDKIMGLKPGPKPIADSTGKPDQRRRDNKKTPGNTPSLKPSKSSTK
ncbi:hypothetical protein BSQ33_12695 [Vibrio gazogenes]|uniref:Uncharacterized protein n=1 Tax=Vibrio gazogenes TaxID=687 RepID=A0A1Z2SH27_VIBGA|nr:hypothetical protein BSQ33_12695 [Vibrio gazogenes]